MSLIKTVFSILIIALLASYCTKKQEEEPQSHFKEHTQAIAESPMTPDELLKKAEADLVKTYGQKVLKQKPFTIKETQDQWIVVGTLHCPEGKNCKGGTARAHYDKKTGELLKVKHTK